MMNPNRSYQKPEPRKEDKLFYIFCEGRRREPEYFRFFDSFSRRITLKPIPPEHGEDHSPTGLFEKARVFFLETTDNPSPQYDLFPDDEVWFVVDTDRWEKDNKIDTLRTCCKEYSGWRVAQSNPCFEAWLYYHFYAGKPTRDLFPDMEASRKWKAFVNTSIQGGFDSERHPKFVGRAIRHAKSNHSETGGKLDVACTEVFTLAENFYPFVKKRIEALLARQGE